MSKFTFGDQLVSQFVVFECKYLFSIIFFYFHESKGEQDRFHTHAFNALSIKFFGEYDEHIIEEDNTNNWKVKKRTKVFKFFPRNSFHRIANSTGCLTLLLSGPWQKTWKEYIVKDQKTVDYSWGREKVKK